MLERVFGGADNTPRSAWAGADEGTQHQQAADEGQSSPDRELYSQKLRSWAAVEGLRFSG